MRWMMRWLMMDDEVMDDEVVDDGEEVDDG